MPIMTPESDPNLPGSEAPQAPFADPSKVSAALQAGYTPAQILDYLGPTMGQDFGAKLSAARSAGYDDKAILGHLTAAAPPQSDDGNIVRGAKTAFGQVAPLMKGVAGLVGATGENTFGEGGLSTGLKDWGLHGYQQGMQQLPPSQPNDDLAQAWTHAKEGHLGALVDYGAYWFGYSMAQLGESAATGLAGAAAGSAVAPGPGTAAGGLAGLAGGTAARGIVKTAIERMVAKTAGEMAAATAERSGVEATAEHLAAIAGSEAVQRAAVKQVASSIGQGTALTAYETMQELGTTYGAAADQATADGRSLDGGDLARVWASGMAAGALGGASEHLKLNALQGRVTMGGPGGRLARGALGGAAGATGEALEEGAQTALERIGAGQSLTDDGAQNDFLNSMAAGAIGGGPIGAIGGVRARRPAPDLSRVLNAPDAAGAAAAAQEFIDAGHSLEQTVTDYHASRSAADAMAAGDVQGAAQLTPTADQSAIVEQPALTDADVSTRLAAAAQQGEAQPAVHALNLVDRGQPVAAQMGELPGDQQAFREAYDAVSANNGTATAAQAAVLDRLSPSERLYDRVEGLPDAPKTAMRGTVLPNAQQLAVADARTQLGAQRMGLTPAPAEGSTSPLVLPVVPSQPRAPLQARLAAVTEELRTDANTARMSQQEYEAQQRAGASQPPAVAPAAPPTPADTVALLKVPAFQRTADQKAALDKATASYTPRQMTLMQQSITAPALLSATDRLEMKGFAGGVQPVARGELPLQSTDRPAAEGGQTHTLTQPIAKVVEQTARLFGLKVKYFTGNSGVDGYVDKSNHTLNLNVNTSVPHLVVAGHEAMHILRRENPAAYDAVSAAVKGELQENAPQEFEKYYGPDAHDLHEELVADLAGNRWAEPEFLAGVFARIQRENPSKAPTIVQALVAALRRAITAMHVALKGAAGFKTDAMVKNLDTVRQHLETAFVEFSKGAPHRAAVAKVEAEHQPLVRGPQPVPEQAQSPAREATHHSQLQPRDNSGHFNGPPKEPIHVPTPAPAQRSGAAPEPAAAQPTGPELAVPERANPGRLSVPSDLRGSAERMADAYRKDQGHDLQGLPSSVAVPGFGPVEFHAWAPAQRAAERYAADAGIDYKPSTVYQKVDSAFAKRVAAAYEAMEHDPRDPEVKAAYSALVKETSAQYETLMEEGLKVEFISAGAPDPYAASPRLAIMDVVTNNHMWVFSTRDGFGTAPFDAADNPLLAETEHEISGQKALANDLFRVVHDYFGHIKDGVGFRADGEDNAWRSHAAMFSPAAVRALTTETRGQNSWLNFGPHAEKNKTAKSADTVYADQKTGLLPTWVSDDIHDDAQQSPSRSAEDDSDEEAPKPKTVEEFHKTLGQQVHAQVESDQLLTRMHTWDHEVGDTLYSKSTGKTYTITGRSYQKAFGSKSSEGKREPIYYYESGQEGEEGWQRGTFREAKMRETGSLINLTRPFTQNSTARSFGTLTPAQEAALKRVGGVTVNQTIAQRAKEFRTGLGARIEQSVFDQFAPLRKLDMTSYMLAKLSKAGDGTLEASLLYGKPFLNDGVPDVNVSDRGFAKTLASLKGEDRRFLFWVAAQRAENLKALGLENLFSQADITELKTLNVGRFDDGTARGPVYQQAFRELQDFNNAVLKIALDSGLIDQRGYDTMADMPYVPFYRVMEDMDLHAGQRFSGGLVNQQAWKKLKGGTSMLKDDLLSNMLQNWSHLFTASARNRAAIAAMREAVRQGIATPIPGAAKHSIKVMEDGVAHYYRVDDPAIMTAITSLEYITPNWIKPLMPFKRWLTIGVTSSPLFKIRNLIRDSVTSIAQADELSVNVLKNVTEGWKHSNPHDQLYASLIASGGVIRFGSSVEGDHSYRARSLIAQQGGQILDEGNAAALWRRLSNVLHSYNEYADKSENANRVAFAMQKQAKGAGLLETAFSSRDMLDFSASGTADIIRILVQTVPFFNARLQGLYRLGRAATSGEKNLIGLNKRFTAVLTTVSLASLALYLKYKDDDDFKKREGWDRDTYWWFKIGDKAIRIPKPFEVGSVGTLAERTYELFMGDKKRDQRMKDYETSLQGMLFNTLSMDPTPQFFKPVLDIYSNKNSFTQAPIETDAMRKELPQDRFDDRTSTGARWLSMMHIPEPYALAHGQWNDLSPVQADYLTRAYFGWLGGQIANMSDAMLRPLTGQGQRPDFTIKDLTGSIVANLPDSGSAYLTTFYNQAKDVDEAWASYAAALKTGDIDRAKELMASKGAELAAHQGVDHVKTAIAKINADMKVVMADRVMDGAAKRQTLLELSQIRSQLAQRGDQLLP